MVAYRILPGLRAQLVAGHRFEDAGGDRKTVLSPALGLGSVEDIVREETEISGCGDLTRELAGEMQILGDDVEVPPAVKAPDSTERGMLSKVRLAPALNGTIRASTPGSTPALAPINSPSSAAMKLV